MSDQEHNAFRDDKAERNDRMAAVVFGNYEVDPPVEGIRQRQDATNLRVDRIEEIVDPLELWVKLLGVSFKYVGIPGTLGAMFLLFRYFTSGGPMP